MNHHRGMLIVAGAHNQREQRGLQRKCRHGRLIRLRKGIYAPREEFQALPLWERFDLHCIATAVGRPANFLMGKAAAAAWEIPFGSVPMWIEMGSRTRNSGERDTVLKIRESTLLPGQPLHRLPTPFTSGSVTSLQQSLLDLARWHPLSDAVEAIDHCLHHGLTTKDELQGLLPLLSGKHGANAAARAIQLSHHASESPRESLIRLAMWEAGFPAPYLQANIRDRYGQFIGRLDYFYPCCCLGIEYDGDGKYQGQFGFSPQQVAEAEMHRTKKMGNAGIKLIRITRATYNDGSWEDDVREALEWGKLPGTPFPEAQWDSAGLAWTRAKYRTRR